MITCYICGKRENGWGWDMRIIHDCDKCGCATCSECVGQYDYGGGYDGNGLTQWWCGPCDTPEAYVGSQNALVIYDPSFARRAA